MKYIYLIRHGQAECLGGDGDDKTRCLTMSGEQETHIMAQALVNSQVKPDMILTSPAKRARGTASILQKALQLPEHQLRIAMKLYLADVATILEQITLLDEQIQRVFIVAHNPGLSYLANYLREVDHIQLPTAGICGFKNECRYWKDFLDFPNECIYYDTPSSVHILP